MTYVPRRLPSRAGAATAVALGVFIAGPAHSADTISIVLDQATITRLPDRVATLVIGNPLIADRKPP